MIRALKTLGALPASDWRVLLSALVVVVAFRVALWVFPYRFIRKMMVRSMSRATPPAETQRVLVRRKRILWAVHAVSRRLLGKKPCLTQALAAQWMLARTGVQPELKIGVAFGEERSLKAHAWLELDDRIIIGGADSVIRYTPLQPKRLAQA